MHAFLRKNEAKIDKPGAPGTSDSELPPSGWRGVRPRGHAVTDLMLRVSHPRMVVSFAVATWVPVW